MKSRQLLDVDHESIAVKHNSRPRQRDVTPASSYGESSGSSDTAAGSSDYSDEANETAVALCDRECEMMEHAYTVYSEMIANSCAVMMRQLDTLSRLVSLSAPMFDLDGGRSDADDDGRSNDDNSDDNNENDSVYSSESSTN